ncbi:hypothetical protein [Salinicola acroporae]|nr:hypothetical protein [Salinicola acroporae]
MPLALAAIAGALVGQRIGGAEASLWGVPLAIAGFGLALALRRRSLWGGLAMLGFLACAHDVGQQRHGILPPSLAGHEFVLTGRILSLDADQRRSRFLFDVDGCRPAEPDDACPAATRVRLSWYGAPELRSGSAGRSILACASR